MPESPTKFILSDMHLVHKWDDADSLKKKSNAVECIAQTISEVKGLIDLDLNGDTLHRPDMPDKEGFDAEKAQEINAPLIEILAHKNAKVLYQEGNCDPWAGQPNFRYQLQCIFDPDAKLRNFQFSEGACEDENMLITHGHILEVPRSLVMQEALPFIDPVGGYLNIGHKLRKFLAVETVNMNGEGETYRPNMGKMLQDRIEREWSGEHHKMHKIRKALKFFGLQELGEEALNRAYTKAFVYGNALAHRAKVVSIGHTHLCALHTREELQKIIGHDIFLPEVFLNTGTATGDRGKPATFGMIENGVVKLMEVDSPSRKAARVRKEASLTV